MAFDPEAFLAGKPAVTEDPEAYPLPFDENDFRAKRKRSERWDEYIDLFSKAHGEDLPDLPKLARAVLMRESGGNPDAVSPAGAAGLMQIMPDTFTGLGGTHPDDRFNPIDNLDKGVQYLAEQYRKFGSPELALAAYNAGPGNVQKHNGIPPFKETQEYVRAAMGYMGALRGASAAPRVSAPMDTPSERVSSGTDTPAFDPAAFLARKIEPPAPTLEQFMVPRPELGNKPIPFTEVPGIQIRTEDKPVLPWDPEKVDAEAAAAEEQRQADAARGRAYLERKAQVLDENPMALYTPERDAALQQGQGQDNRSWFGKTAGDVAGSIRNVTQLATAGLRGGYDAAVGARARETEENLAAKSAGEDPGFLEELREAGKAMAAHPEAAIREIGLALVEDAPLNALATFGVGAVLRGAEAALGARRAAQLAARAQKAGKSPEVVERARRMGQTREAVRATEKALTQAPAAQTVGRAVAENVAGAGVVSVPQAEAQGRTYGPADAFQDVFVGSGMGAPLGLLRAAKDARITKADFDKVKDVAYVAGMERHPAVQDMLPRFRALAESPEVKGIRFKVDPDDLGRRHWTREDLDAAGYQDREPGLYDAAGETAPGQITLRRGAGAETQIEEAAHFLQDRLRAKAAEEGPRGKSPYRDLLNSIRGWEESVRAEARQEGLKLPEGDELFAQTFTAHMGYADRFPESVRRVVLPDTILEGFRKLMGEDPALRGAGERPQGDITGKGLRPENTPVETIEEVFRGDDPEARQKWLRILFPEYAPGGAIGQPARVSDPTGYAIATEMMGPEDHRTYKPVTPRDIDIRGAYEKRVLGPLREKEAPKPETQASGTDRPTAEQEAAWDREWEEMAAAGTTPFQLKPGPRYQLAGPQAKDFPKAQREGRVFPGKYDDKPRFEFDDSRAKWTPKAQERIENPEAQGKPVFGTLAEVLDHPELYRNYPDIAKIPVAITVDPKIMEPGGRLTRTVITEGRKKTVLPEIKVSVNSSWQAREALMHEIQHAIQYQEDFAKGGNWTTGLSPEERARIEQGVGFKEATELRTKGLDAYHRLAGEIEARDTQHRSDKPYALRRQNFKEAYRLLQRAREVGKDFDHSAREWQGSPEQIRTSRIYARLEDLGFGGKNMASHEWRALRDGDIDGVAPKPYSSEQIPREQGIVRYQLKEAEGDAPLDEGKSDGRPPRVERRVTDLRRAEEAQDWPPSNLDRETKEGWEQLDPEVRKLLREKDADYFMDIVKKGESLRAAEVQAFDALVRGKREKVEELRQASLKDPQNGQARQEYLVAQVDYIAAEKAMINDGTGTARALAARNRIMLGRGQDNDANMIRKISKEIPGMTDRGVGILVRTWRESPEKFPDALRNAMSFSKADKALELWKAGLLSAPSTDLANITGNALEHATRMVENAVAGGVDWAIQKLDGGERTRFLQDAAAEFSGTAQEFFPALRRFAQGLKDVVLLKDKPLDMGEKFEFQTGAVGGPVGKVARTSFRKLEVEDQFFKDLIYGAELRKHSYRTALSEGKKGKAAAERAAEIEKEVRTNPENHIPILRAVKLAQQERTFQGETGPLAKLIMRANQTVKTTQVVMPFVKTPANIFRTTLERSPAGWGRAVKAFNAYRDAKRNGAKPEEVQKLRGAAADAIARTTLGTSLLGGFVGYALAGGMTGGGPTSAKENNLLRETGWQPYSFVFRDGEGKKHFIPFNRFEPISSLLGFAADLAEIRDQKEAGDMAQKALGAVVENLINKSYLQGLTDAATLLDNPGMHAKRYISNLVGSLVPNIVNRVAKAVDPVKRDVTPEKTGLLGIPEAVAKSVQSRIPFASRSLPARRSGTGQEIVRNGGALGRFAGPVQFSKERDGAELNEELVSIGYAPSAPPREITVPGTGKKVRVTDEEFEILAEARARAATRFERMMGGASYQNKDPEERRQLAKNIFDREMDSARKKILPAARRRLKALE